MIFRLLEVLLALVLLVFLIKLIVTALTATKKTNDLKDTIVQKERELQDEELLDHLHEVDTKIVEKQKKRTDS